MDGKHKGQDKWGYPNPFNEVENRDPNKPDAMGDDLYYQGWDEVMKMHLQDDGPLITTVNSDASHDVYGGPIQGEPNPGHWGGNGGSSPSAHGKTVDKG